MKFPKILIIMVSLFNMNTSYSETTVNPNPLGQPLSKSGTLARAIETDDVASIEQLFSQPDFPTEISLVDEYELYCDEDFDVVPLIDAAAFFNSINVFKFLLQNDKNLSPTIQTMNMFSMYRHNNYEIFRLCEQYKVTPNDNTLFYSFNSLNIDLFAYINTHYQNLYTFEYFARISCYTPDIVNGGVSICGKKFGDIRKQFVENYPIVFESFLRSDTNNLLRFEEVLGKYFRLSSYPFKEKIELPIFER